MKLFIYVARISMKHVFEEYMANAYTINPNPYVLDLDRNNQLAFTKKNMNLIYFAINIDSNYRIADSSILIKKFMKTRDVGCLDEIIEKIDKENATHLKVKRADKGIKNFIKKYEPTKLIKRLSDADDELVKEIANASASRNNFSFASKFCAFMCRSLFEGESKADNYAIYDSVLANVLPYYAWVYLKEDHLARINSKIEAEFKDATDYQGYKQLIDSIRGNIKKITGFEISRKDFDQMLWYYYKGIDERYKNALKFVRDENSVLI